MQQASCQREDFRRESLCDPAMQGTRVDREALHTTFSVLIEFMMAVAFR